MTDAAVPDWARCSVSEMDLIVAIEAVPFAAMVTADSSSHSHFLNR